MQNGHFYFCTSDIVGIRFLKSGDFAWDILTIFQNTLHAMLFCKKQSIFSFDHPSHAKLQFFSKITFFLHLPKLRKWPIVDRGRRFQHFSYFSLLKLELYNFELEVPFGHHILVLSRFLGGLLAASETPKVHFLRQGSSKMTSRRSAQGCCKEA